MSAYDSVVAPTYQRRMVKGLRVEGLLKAIAADIDYSRSQADKPDRMESLIRAESQLKLLLALNLVEWNEYNPMANALSLAQRDIKIFGSALEKPNAGTT